MTTVEEAKARTRGIVMDQVDRGTTIAGNWVREYAANVRTVSGALRNDGYDATADLVETAADKMNGFSSYLIDNGGERVVHDVEELARRRPVATAAVGLIVGWLGARLLKSSNSSGSPSAWERK